MKYKVGDKVRIRKYKDIPASADIVSDMRQYCGKIATIKYIYGINGDRFNIDLDNQKWGWTDEMVESLEPTELDIYKKALEIACHYIDDEFADASTDYYIQRAKQELSPILDKEEKEYLSAVIRPFKTRVNYIKRCRFDEEFSYINIVLKDTDGFAFPNFKNDTMYKGMKVDKKYTLKELGLE